jgi:hypothetical protein
MVKGALCALTGRAAFLFRGNVDKSTCYKRLWQDMIFSPDLRYKGRAMTRASGVLPFVLIVATLLGETQRHAA